MSRLGPMLLPIALRAIGHSLAWLPATLTIALAALPGASAGWLAAVPAAALLGALLALWRPLAAGFVRALPLAASAACAAWLDMRWLLPALYLGLVAWWGGSRLGRLPVCIAGVAMNALALIAASWGPELEAYRGLFIVSGAVWFLLSVWSGHAELLDSAGLHDGIVTRLVSRSSRRYLMILLAVVLIVYVATSGFHTWQSIIDNLRIHPPKHQAQNIEQPPAMMPSAPLPLPGAKQTPDWLQWLDTAFLLLAALAGAVAIVLLAKRYLLNGAWFRGLRGRLRTLLQWLLRRREPSVKPAYTDEEESLLDLGKALRQAQARWRRKGSRKPIGRREWERLAPSEKVRRLYAETVTAAVDAGFELRRADTPSETLRRLEGWYAKQAASGESAAGNGRWLRRVRALLEELYGGARYGAREATSAELEALAGDYPWESRR